VKLASLFTSLTLALANIISVGPVTPSYAVTYSSVLDLSIHGNVTMGLYQAGELVDEAYDFDVDYHFVFGSLQAERDIVIDLRTGAESSTWIWTRPTTDSCTLEVGVGYASGRILEQDPKRVLGSIPLTINWTRDTTYGFDRWKWQLAASGTIPGPTLSDIGSFNNLLFHVKCDGQVLDVLKWTFGYGIVGRPVLTEPNLSITGNTATVDVGNVRTNSVTDLVQIIFEYCQDLVSACVEFGSKHTYYAYQVESPIEFTLTGVEDVYIRIWVGAANSYGTSSEYSKHVALGSPKVQADQGASTLGLLVQLAGSQVFITSADLQGSYEIYEDGVLIDSFTFDGVKQAHIVEQRVTGAIQIRKNEGGSASLVSYEMTKTLLWYQNVNLGSFSETNLGSGAREKVSNLVKHRYLDSGSWKQRDSEVTKFICTGIYREGGSAAEKLSARKKAKLACESAKSLDNDPNSQVSFFYQTKTTKAASYVGKVLITVKGIEPFVASRIN